MRKYTKIGEETPLYGNYMIGINKFNNKKRIKMKAYQIDKKATQYSEVNTLIVNESYEGEMIEKKIERITVNKEPLTDGAPVVYTERKDGVRPEYDIKTDKWDIAIEAMDKVEKTHKTRRQDAIKKRQEEKDGKAEPAQGTTSGNDQQTS